MTYWKQTAAAAVVSIGMLAPSLQHSYAATLTPVERSAIVAKIDALIEEIDRLEALLEERRAEAFLSAAHIQADHYETTYYTDAVEQILPVVDGKLVATDAGAVRQVDRDLFAILRTTIGAAALETYIREFRVFDDETRDIGAFIELKAGTDEWIIGVNRNVYDEDIAVRPERVEGFYEQLFIHEYAHILTFYFEDIEDVFADRFWTKSHWRHAEAVEDVQGDERFEKLSAYYRKHDDEFVSDYATVNPDEDLAETFVVYVYDDVLPTERSTVAAKKRFLADTNVFRDAREVIRENLGMQ